MNKTSSKVIKCSLCGKTLLKNANISDKPYWVMRKEYPDRPPVCNDCIYEMFETVKEKDISTLNHSSNCNISEESKNMSKRTEKKSPKTISDLFAESNKFVKNQDQQLISIIRAIRHNVKADNQYTKSNIMLIGSPGTGKTLIANTLASVMNVPYVIVNATDYTEVGYYGKDVDTMINELYKASGYNVEKTQRGIIFIDEIDKKNSTSEVGRDVSGAKVIESLLPMLQGTVVQIPSSSVFIDTSFITFVVMGVFEDLKKVRSKRLNQNVNIGFSQIKQVNKEDITSYVAEDLLEIGFNTQFTARFSNIIELNEHTKESLMDIVKKSSASGIKPWKEEFEKIDIDLQVTNDFLEEVVNRALALKVGARGISRILNEMMLYVLNDITDSKLQGKACLLDKSTLDDFKSYKII